MMNDESLVEAGREATLGPLVRKVGHLVRNKLAVLGNSTYYLRLRLGDADEKVSKHLNLMEREVAVASAVVADLMDFVLVKKTEPRPMGVNQLVSEVLSRLAHPDTVEVIADLTPGLPLIEADAAQIAHALEKLLVNAVEAMVSAGDAAGRSRRGLGGEASVALLPEERLTVRTGLDDDEQTVWITISDTGPGIPDEVQARLFDPLFTTKPQDFGLGLPI
ncbi:MAG: ATP-binding protein, partial [Chloroflexota bacterium]|nr:ATP-binding protein [Chloroflexota bacterium]